MMNITDERPLFSGISSVQPHNVHLNLGRFLDLLGPSPASGSWKRCLQGAQIRSFCANWGRWRLWARL